MGEERRGWEVMKFGTVGTICGKDTTATSTKAIAITDRRVKFPYITRLCVRA